jgi:hypothetical protein
MEKLSAVVTNITIRGWQSHQRPSSMLPVEVGDAANGARGCYQRRLALLPACRSAMLLAKIVLEYFEMGNEILFYTKFYFATLVFS